VVLRGQGHGQGRGSLRPRRRPWAFEVMAKATGLQGQGRGSSRPRPRPWAFEAKAKAVALQRSRPMSWVFEAKEKAADLHSRSRPRSRPQLFVIEPVLEVEDSLRTPSLT